MTDYVRPGYPELRARIDTDLAAMPAVLRGPLSAAWARACHGQHGFLEWIDAQCNPLTCELERLYDWAALYAVYRLPSSPAVGLVYATGSVGAELLANTVLRGKNGLDYVVLSAVTLAAGNTPVSVRCVTPGRSGNLFAGDTLTLVEPVFGVSASLSVAGGGLSGGEDEESLENWRLRVIEEWTAVVSRGGRSGKVDDYIHWAKSAHPSVTGALVQPHALGIGTVLVRPVCNGLLDRYPTQAVINAVKSHFLDVAPATADWRVARPLLHYVDPVIDLLPGVDSEVNRSAIYSALQSLLLSKSSNKASLSMAEIDAAIASVTRQYIRLGPLSDIHLTDGKLFVLGEIVWV